MHWNKEIEHKRAKFEKVPDNWSYDPLYFKLPFLHFLAMFCCASPSCTWTDTIIYNSMHKTGGQVRR